MIVDRAKLGVAAEPHEMSGRYDGHEDRVRYHEQRVFEFYNSPAGRADDGVEAVLGFMPDERRARRSQIAREYAAERQDRARRARERTAAERKAERAAKNRERYAKRRKAELAKARRGPIGTEPGGE